MSEIHWVKYMGWKVYWVEYIKWLNQVESI